MLLWVFGADPFRSLFTQYKSSHFFNNTNPTAIITPISCLGLTEGAKVAGVRLGSPACGRAQSSKQSVPPLQVYPLPRIPSEFGFVLL